MNKIVVSVLGDTFKCFVTSKYSFKIYDESESFIIDTVQLLDVESHWRALVKKGIEQIIDLKIQRALNEN